MAVMTLDEFKKKYGREPGMPSQVSQETPPQTPALGSRLGTVYKESASKIGTSITRGADKIGQAKDLPGAVGASLEAGLGTAAGAARAVFAPAEAATGAVADATGIHPIKALADTFPEQAQGLSSWAERHPDAARNLGDIITVGTAGFLGGKNPLKADLGGASNFLEKTKGTSADFVAKGEKAHVDRAVNEALQLTRPILNKKATINSFVKAGKPGGVSTGALGKIDYTPTAFDKEVAQVASPFISKSKNAAQNSYNLGQEIERFSKDEVRPFLEANPRAVNAQTVEAKLKSIPIPDLFKTDPVLERTYKLVREKMMTRIRESGGNTVDIWDARKQFDADVIKEFGDVAFTDSKYTPIRRAITDMRTAVNDFIGTQIGDDTFKEQLKRLSRLYEAQDRIATGNYKLLGSNVFTRWALENPEKAKLIKWGVGLTLGAGAIKGLVE